uniref:Uncharacterized protein n=1 Tax=Cannabis sativa TaxID=3483 RepID=A0A803NLT0_CANSA
MRLKGVVDTFHQDDILLVFDLATGSLSVEDDITWHYSKNVGLESLKQEKAESVALFNGKMDKLGTNGLGGFSRVGDSSGHVLASETHKQRGRFSVEMAESLAIHFGLQLA